MAKRKHHKPRRPDRTEGPRPDGPKPAVRAAGPAPARRAGREAPAAKNGFPRRRGRPDPGRDRGVLLLRRGPRPSPAGSASTSCSSPWTRPGPTIWDATGRRESRPQPRRSGRGRRALLQRLRPGPPDAPEPRLDHDRAEPVATGVHNNGTYELAADRTTLAEVLKADGYATAAFVASFSVDSRFGIAQGFDHYDDNYQEGSPFKAVNAERRAEQVYGLFSDWMDANPDRAVLLLGPFLRSAQPLQSALALPGGIRRPPVRRRDLLYGLRLRADHGQARRAPSPRADDHRRRRRPRRGARRQGGMGTRRLPLRRGAPRALPHGGRGAFAGGGRRRAPGPADRPHADRARSDGPSRSGGNAGREPPPLRTEKGAGRSRHLYRDVLSEREFRLGSAQRAHRQGLEIHPRPERGAVRPRAGPGRAGQPHRRGGPDGPGDARRARPDGQGQPRARRRLREEDADRRGGEPAPVPRVRRLLGESRRRDGSRGAGPGARARSRRTSATSSR